MKVRLDTSLVWFGVAYHHGDTIELPDDVALKYIATRQAERIEQAGDVHPIVEAETATLERSRPNQMKHFHKHKRG